MAITYDLILEEVGGSSSLVEGVTTSDYALTSLSDSVDYVVKVRAVDTTAGVRVPSAYVTLAFTSAAADTAVTVNLDSLSLSSTLGSITPVDTVVPTIVDEYDLLLIEDGGSPQIIRGIATSDYALTGLTGDTSHTVAVRTAKIVNGVTYLSDWTSDSAFSTAGASSPVSVTIGSLTTPITLNIVTPVETVPQASGVFYEVELTDVLNDTSVIYDTQNTEFPLVGLIEGREYQVSVRKVTDISGTYYPSAWVSSTAFVASAGGTGVSVSLGSLSYSPTISNVVPIDTTPTAPVAADSWTVTLYKVSDNSVADAKITRSNSIAFQDLQVSTEYRVEIVGHRLGGSSSVASTVFTALGTSLNVNLFTTSSPLQDLDVFFIDSILYSYDTATGQLSITGTTNTPLDQISSGTIDGNVLIGEVNGNQFTLATISGTLSTYMMEELEGEFDIEINSSGDLLEIT